VTGLKFAIYPPAQPGLPWLAVVLAGDKPLDMFGCAGRETAEKLVQSMRARRQGRNGSDREHYT
jgi:hypothetical protein